MCGGGPPPGTSCDSTALTTPPVSRPWRRMTMGIPRILTFLPPSLGTWIGFMLTRVELLRPALTSQCPLGDEIFESAAHLASERSIHSAALGGQVVTTFLVGLSPYP